MAISYPLTFPTHTGIRSMNIRAVNVVAASTSPFTLRQQVVKHFGQRWEAEISLPPMSRTDAEQWVAWLMSLGGIYGTFNMPIYPYTPRGSASTAPGTPLVNGASQIGQTLLIDGAPNSAVGYLKAGDFIQRGAGASATLHKVLTDVTSSAGGACTLELWPEMRTAVADNAAIVVSTPQGLFRLASNETNYSVDDVAMYGITFGAVEVVI